MASKTTRLQKLEAQAVAQRAAIEGVKDQQALKATERLSPEERQALCEWMDLCDTNPEELGDISRLLEYARSSPLPGGDEALRWVHALEDTPDGLPWPPVPQGRAGDFAFYFDAEADRAARVSDVVVLSPALRTGASITAAYWRWNARVADVMGEQQRWAQPRV